MRLFDFFMPGVAQATHLRQIASSNVLANTQARLQSARLANSQRSSDARVKALEEVGQLTIIVELLMECLEEKGSVTKPELMQKIGEVDTRDGVIDGRITKEPQESSPSGAKKLNIPGAS